MEQYALAHDDLYIKHRIKYVISKCLIKQTSFLISQKPRSGLENFWLIFVCDSAIRLVFDVNIISVSMWWWALLPVLRSLRQCFCTNIAYFVNVIKQHCYVFPENWQNSNHLLIMRCMSAKKPSWHTTRVSANVLERFFFTALNDSLHWNV
jgi:hypothetical protein